MAYQMRRRTSTFHTVRHASANDGTGSSVSATASLTPIARRSWTPRIGSRRRSENITRIAIGMVNTMNGRPPPEGRRDRAGDQRPQALAGRHRRAVEREDRGPSVDGVVVREERVVSRIVHRLADAGRRSARARAPHRGHEPGEEREDPHHDGADDHQPHPVRPVGHDRDRELQQQSPGQRDRHDRGDAGVAHPEVVADVGEQDRRSRTGRPAPSRSGRRGRAARTPARCRRRGASRRRGDEASPTSASGSTARRRSGGSPSSPNSGVLFRLTRRRSCGLLQRLGVVGVAPEARCGDAPPSGQPTQPRVTDPVEHAGDAVGDQHQHEQHADRRREDLPVRRQAATARRAGRARRRRRR